MCYNREGCAGSFVIPSKISYAVPFIRAKTKKYQRYVIINKKKNNMLKC